MVFKIRKAKLGVGGNPKSNDIKMKITKSLKTIKRIKNPIIALSSVVQLVVHCPMHQNVTNSISVHGTCPGCRLDYQ